LTVHRPVSHLRSTRTVEVQYLQGTRGDKREMPAARILRSKAKKVRVLRVCCCPIGANG
jgi:hypothetical protein